MAGHVIKISGESGRPPANVLSVIDFNRNCASLFYGFQAIASYLSIVANFNLPHLHLAPPLGVTRLSFAEIFGVRKLESLGYRVALTV